MEKISDLLTAVAIFFAAYVSYVIHKHKCQKELTLSKKEAISAKEEINAAIVKIRQQVHSNSEWIKYALPYIETSQSPPFEVVEFLKPENFNFPEIKTILTPPDSLPKSILAKISSIRELKINLELEKEDYLHKNGIDHDFFQGVNNALRTYSSKLEELSLSLDIFINPISGNLKALKKDFLIAKDFITEKITKR